MVELGFSRNFKNQFGKIKNKQFKQAINKQLRKIELHPEIGKPLTGFRKGTREVYVSPHRLSYLYENNRVLMLDVYHKDEQ
ncbi:MAG: type II toxin-antitoxin system RelE/ParE family toxin [Candidatus Woesearchaeota archaeon]|nr:MAG: type II toxin-antitoxin system RelE/ParE family toxin [Candidatus Woesearchaeota archaeon]